MRIPTAALAGILLMTAASCDNADKNGGYKKTENGLEYKMIEDKEGDKTPKPGDVIKFDYSVTIGDSLVFSIRKMNNNMPMEVPYEQSPDKKSWSYGMELLSPGDSVEFRVPVDTVRKYAQGQFFDWAKSGDYVYYRVRMIDITTQEELKAKQQEQLNSDDQKLQAYFKANNINNAQKTESGLYYVIEKPGNGSQIQRGKTVSINYTGRNLQGEVFDSNVDPEFQHVEPLTFKADEGQMIKGMIEGVLLLKNGSQATLYIPSALGYGTRSMGPKIGANENLIFDVEVTDVKPAAAQNPAIQ